MKKIVLLLSLSVYLLAGNFCHGNELTWDSIKQSGYGKIVVHYRINEPFFKINNSGTFSGLEYEMMIGFQAFLLDKYNVKLDIEWKKQESFKEIFDYIKDKGDHGDFGINVISKTHERAKYVNFSEPYFPDIQVLTSNRSVPTASAIDDFKTRFEKYTAISVPETTYDLNLKSIRKKYAMSFQIEYSNGTDNEIIERILATDYHFGYIGLPNYLMALNSNKPIKRHNIFPVKGIGYCIISNFKSDWSAPLDEYLTSRKFEMLKNKSIQKHLGQNVNNLIANILKDENEEIILLKEEKKIIDKELSKKELEVKRQSLVRNLLIAIIILALFAAYFLYNRNRVKTTANEVLTLHRKMIESQNALLNKRNEELIELNEEKNNFIHIVSHDLRSPINNITGLTKVMLMEEDNELNEEQLRIIAYISAESRRLNKMVTRILDAEKIESKTPEQYRKIDLNKVLKRVLENYESQAEAKHISFKTKFKSGIEVLGLEQFLFHVFENLISNSIKFSPPEKTVSIESVLTDDIIAVKITDEGPGMTEEDKKKMFKKFQVLSAKATAGERSTGLGLSIVNKYVKLLGGKLECDSKPGKGTTFTVKLKIITKATEEIN